jgi:hypothetical protein
LSWLLEMISFIKLRYIWWVPFCILMGFICHSDKKHSLLLLSRYKADCLLTSKWVDWADCCRWSALFSSDTCWWVPFCICMGFICYSGKKYSLLLPNCCKVAYFHQNG